MTFEQFRTVIAEPLPHLRHGQQVFNQLSLVRPDLTDLLVDTNVDPFYSDETLPAFWSWVAEHWDKS